MSRVPCVVFEVLSGGLGVLLGVLAAEVGFVLVLAGLGIYSMSETSMVTSLYAEFVLAFSLIIL